MLHLHPFVPFALQPAELTGLCKKKQKPVDAFEEAHRKEKEVLQRAATADALVALVASAQLTAKWAPSKRAACTQEKAVELSQRLQATKIGKEDLFALRADMLMLERTISELRKEKLKETLQNCSARVRGHLTVLSAFEDLVSEDIEVAKARFSDQGSERQNRHDALILRRFDAGLLEELAVAGVCSKATTQEVQAHEERLENRRNVLEAAKRDAVAAVFQNKEKRKAAETQFERTGLEQCDNAKLSAMKRINAEIGDVKRLEAQLSNHCEVKGVYYGINSAYRTCLERFTVLLDEAAISVASRQRIEKEVLESLYRQNKALFSAFGVVEKLESWEFHRLLRKKQVNPEDYVQFDTDRCRLSKEGLRLLYDCEPRLVPYAFGTLDMTAELY